MPVKIAAAAIRWNGEIYSLPRPARHADIIRHYHEVRKPRDTVLVFPGGEQGFLTDEEPPRFVTRREAVPIARAADQLIVPELRYKDTLFSEDIW